MHSFPAAALGLLSLIACVGGPERGTTAAQSSRDVAYHDERYSFDVSYPANWSRAEEQLTDLGAPKELLVLATFPLVEGGGCAPKTALDRAGTADAIVFLTEFTATMGKKPPARPSTFRPLPEPAMSDCWDAPVSTYIFRDGGGRFQLDVWLGEEVEEATKEEAIRVLDSLRFGTREHTGSFFERVVAILRERAFGILHPATKEQRRDAVPLRELRARVRRRLENEHASARLIDVTLGIFITTSERLAYRKLMYVVHTGPFSTGDCLDFYDAKTLDYDLGSCFLTDRDL